jgi:hypothetical protein
MSSPPPIPFLTISQPISHMRLNYYLYVFLFFVPVVCGRDAPPRSIISTAGVYDYIVSVPDVHGDIDILLRSLWMAKNDIEGVVGGFEDFRKEIELEMKKPDSKLVVPPTKILLIQTGDIIDRGPNSKSCYEAIWAAERVLGWKLVNLLGNHEAMTIAGQADHYAHKGDVSEFGSLEARRAEFSPGGRYWKKITDEFLIMVKVHVGDERVLFVHAGINPAYINRLKKDKFKNKTIDTPDELIEQLNVFLMTELKQSPRSSYLSHEQSPIWTRDLASANEKTACNTLFPKVVTMLNITRMVVGHTPQQNLLTGNRCGGNLLLADVAMSRWMGSGQNGNPAVLVFRLKDNGALLGKISNLYWKGDVKGEKGEVKTEVIFETKKESEQPEL